MRASFPSIVALLLALSFGAFANAQMTAPNTLTMNLSLASRGPQVTALQQLLNRDPDTQIASAGPGSPGNETSYFGSLTKSAVIRFQEKYASEILTPSGLTQGNGFVGFYSRKKLSELSLVVTYTGSAAAPVAPAVTPPSAMSVPPSTPSPILSLAPQNPNLKNIETFLNAIDSVAARQGLSAASIGAIKQQVLKDVATTTDLRAAFLNIVQKQSSSTALNDSSSSGLLATIQKAFEKVFGLQHARAATGTPFGGALLFSFFCTQSATWLITLEPLPPSYAALLTYVPFSQAYLSYNIPATPWLLGEYEPGAGVCVAGVCPACTTIPSEGMMSSKTGSAPL